jgi:O-antigen/teichoic acid export membrane protein
MLVILTFLINSVFNFALGLLLAHCLGPSSYGQYAIATAIAVVLNVLFLDWVRFSATRFYSLASMAEDAGVRATLDCVFGLSAGLIVIIGAVAVLTGNTFGLPKVLVVLTPVVAICYGLFDYHTALLRARFDQRRYSLLIVWRNLLSLVLTVGGTWWFESPAVAMAGACIAVVAALLMVRRALTDAGANWRVHRWSLGVDFARYAVPIVLANASFSLIPLMNRGLIAAEHGFAESGQFSLSFDLASRLVVTVASAADILLFQMAVRTQQDAGEIAAQRRLEDNLGLVLMTLSAVGVGFWLVLPSFAALLVPQAFQATFATLATLILPGLMCQAFVQAGLATVFQLRRETWPLLLVSGTALATNALLMATLAKGATGETVALLQSVALGVSLLVALVLVVLVSPVRPRTRDVVATALAVAAMLAVVLPLRGMGTGVGVLALSVAAGGLAFLAVVVAVNAGGARAGLALVLRRAQAQRA